jgi:hypothetical protein
MKILILIIVLLPFTGQSLRPEVYRLESRMDLIKDGMSVEEVLKVLHISKKKGLHAVAHGAVTYRYLGEGYTLAVPFGTPDFLKRILLMDESGKTIKEVAWR